MHMITRFLKLVSAIMSVHYKTVRYIEGLRWEFDQFRAVPRNSIPNNEVFTI